MSGIGIGMLLPAVQQVRNAARRSSSMNNIRQLVLATHNFESAYGGWPSSYTKNENGERLLSWRVHILPYLEQNALYEQFHLDEPWDSPHNKKLIAQMPVLFENPGIPLENGMTCYQGVAGEAAILADPKHPVQEDGKMAKGSSMKEVVDGMSNTILIVETNNANGVVWTKPDDFDYTADKDILGRLQGTWPGQAINVGFADGSCRAITNLTNEQLKWLMMKNDGHDVDPEDFLPIP